MTELYEKEKHKNRELESKVKEVTKKIENEI